MLSVFTLEQSDKWDSIVRTFANHDVYWLSGYVRAFKIHGDGEPLLFFYENGTTRGINVVMKRDIAKDDHFADRIEQDTYFDFATPYGYGGWLIEGDEVEALFDSYRNWCVKNGIISEFVRFHPVLKNHGMAVHGYNVIPLGETVAMDLSNADTIWSNLTSKNRNMIRKAKKNGIRIYQARNEAIYKEFREIYNSTMDKDHASAYYYFGDEFYKSLLEDLPYNAQVFYAEMEGRIIAASVMIMENGRMNYHFSGSVREYTSLAPSNLLLYEAALWGSLNGYKTLHLGGGVGSGEDSLFKFKRAFYRGEDLLRFHIGSQIFLKERYDELTALRTDLPESGFFPRYRA